MSLSFKLGKHSGIAAKIVDARGVESLKIVPVEYNHQVRPC
jgi:hypothetical protein